MFLKYFESEVGHVSKIRQIYVYLKSRGSNRGIGEKYSFQVWCLDVSYQPRVSWKSDRGHHSGDILHLPTLSLKSVRQESRSKTIMPAGKIGINGFGRIGRLVLRAAVEKGATVIKKYRSVPQKKKFLLQCTLQNKSHLSIVNQKWTIVNSSEYWGNDLNHFNLIIFTNIAGGRD